MTPAGPLGRDAMAFREKMVKYHGEIERLVYAAEIHCPNIGVGECVEGCIFDGRGDPECEYWCRLGAIRDALGDHVQQHDCMVPPCQCAGDCGIRQREEQRW